MKILAVDYGDSRTGLAQSVPGSAFASGLTTLFEKRPKALAEQIAKKAQEIDAEEILIGMPKNMDNSMGPRGEKTLEFIDILKKYTNTNIVTWDERLTTLSAVRILNETNTRGQKRKNIIDTVAAELLLQSYLDYKTNTGGNENG